MLRFFIILFISGIAATPLFSAERTWDGGGADFYWSTAGNWDGSAPVAGDTLFFGGTARVGTSNDLTTDTSFAGITFNIGAGAFVLDGNRLTLGGELINLDADTQTINLDLVLPDIRTMNATNGTLAINGILSGSGGLIKRGSYPLILTGGNSYEGTTTVKTNGALLVQHNQALGSTNGATVVENGGWMEVSGGVTVDEPITLSGDSSTSFAGVLRNTDGDNVWQGHITTTFSRIKVYKGSLVVKGGITGPGVVLASQPNATLIISNQPVNVGYSTVYAHSGGTKIFAVSNNMWGTMDASGGIVRTDAPHAFPPASTLKIGVSYSVNSHIDLNGNDQTIGRIYSGTTDPGTRVMTTAEPATLTVNQSADTLLDSMFTGALTLVKTGSGSLTLESVSHSYTGGTIISNGTLVVASGSTLGNSTQIVIEGGVLELQSAGAIDDSAVLSLSGTGQLRFSSALSETVDVLFLDSIQKEAGTWGATGSGATHIDDDHFVGAGTLTVLRSPPVPIWDGEGADTLMSNEDNWTGDGYGLPAFNGSTNVTFGTGGSVATVDTAVNLTGMIFNREGDFHVEAGDGSLAIGTEGISAMSPTTESRTYTVSEDIALTANQEWSIVNNLSGTTTMEVTGRLSGGEGASDITISGGGVTVLSGDNTYRGETLVETGVVRIAHSHALGASSAGTTINTLGNAKLELSGDIVVDEPLKFIGGSTGKDCLLSQSGSNTLAEVIEVTSGRFHVNQGSTLLISGGVTGANSFFVINAVGTMILNTTALTLGTGHLYADSEGVTILDVAGNQWGSTTVARGTLKMNAAGAMPPNASVRIGVSYATGGTLNLNGFDQAIGSLYSGTTLAGNRIITSETPALLTINQSSDKTFNGTLEGAVGLIKNGAATLTLEGWGSTTTGDFIISNGTLVVASDSNLGYSTNIVVAAGTLNLQSEHAIRNTARLNIENGGSATVSIAGGLTEQVGQLFFGGEEQAGGSWGATGSGAEHIDDAHFNGMGQLLVSDTVRNLSPEYFIAPDGNATNQGSRLQPFASMEQARDSIRQTIHDGGMRPDGGVTIWLRAGLYTLTNTFELIAADSGTASHPVTYRAFPGETVRLHGAKELEAEWFTVVSNTSPVWARLDPQAQGHLMQVDLTAHGISDFGILRERGIASYAGTSVLELFFDTTPQQLARWPDVDETNPDALNGFAYTVDATTDIDFTYSGNRPERWLQAEEPWLHGFWYKLWADVHLRVGAISTNTSTITLATVPDYYNVVNRGMPYYAENLLEEITLSGEWYLNRSTGILYFWPPEDPAGHEIFVSMLAAPLVSLTDVHYVTLRDIIFEMTRGDLVNISEGSNNRVIHCILRNSGNYAAQVSGYRNGISGCEIRDTGDGGVKLAGGDRTTLTGAGNYVRNSTIHGFGRWAWMYKPGVNVQGVGHIVTHNLFYDAPHTAILLGGGNYHLIALNEVRDVCRWTSDAGAIYTGRDLGAYGTIMRHNFVHDIAGRFGISHGTMGIYLDDTIAGIEVFGNICYQVSHLGIQHGGGRDILMENNILAKCGTGFGPDARGIGWRMDSGGSFEVWTKLQSLPYRDSIWSNAFPSLALMPTNWETVVNEEWMAPYGCVFSRNLGYSNTVWINNRDNATSYFSEVADNLPDEDPLFVDEANLDLTLSKNSPAFTIPGFQDIPFARIGPESGGDRELASWTFPDATERRGFSYEDLSVPGLLTVSGMNAIAAPGHPTWSIGVPYGDIGGTNEVEAVAYGDYFEFSLSPRQRQNMSLAKLSFEHRQSGGEGDVTLFVRSSADDYTGTLGSTTLTESNTWQTTEISLTGVSALQYRFDSVTFRIYAFRHDEEFNTQRLSVDNATVCGSVLSAGGSRVGTVLIIE